MIVVAVLSLILKMYAPKIKGNKSKYFIAEAAAGTAG